nr:MAG TPA: hypothetical protein [Caudoviricetes sp.]
MPLFRGLFIIASFCSLSAWISTNKHYLALAKSFYCVFW